MRKPKISYSLTRHASQSRAAAAYQAILAERYEIVGNQDQADIVIVHHPPRNYETVYALHPALKDKYVISCCVAHASDLPATWRRNLERVQEVWTCSRFCRDVFARYHPRVTLIPYAVERDFACSADALECVKRLIDFRDDRVYFLAIAPADETRKNVPCLVEGFMAVADAMPNARLVVKGTHLNSPSWAPHSQVLFLPLMMPFEYINALYQLAHVYASAHHAESWGLTISDAMLYGLPVIATGHSGNMDYMSDANSFPLRFAESTVPADLAGFGVERGMKWVDPDQSSIQENLLRLYATHAEPETLEKAARGRDDVRRIDRAHVATFINGSIEAASNV